MNKISQTLPRAMPHMRGTNPAVILSVLDEIERENIELHSLLIWQDGALITDAYWAPFSAERPHMMHSVTKSFTSMAVGLAVADGLLSVDDPVISFFPEYLHEELDANLRAMRVRHLLTMTSGHGRGISGGSWRRLKTSWIEDFLKQSIPFIPGETFVYDSAASYMLSALVQKVTGRPIHDYLKERIFAPMAMSGTIDWDIGTDGVNTGGNGLSCTSEDMLKLGILHLQGGEWQGKQLLPRDWVETATAIQIRDVVLGVFTGDHYLGPDEQTGGEAVSKREGYGYQWWRGPHNSFSANGLFGQYCIILPDQKTVVAFTGGLADSDRRVHQLIYERLLPALGSGTDEDAAETAAALQTRLAGLHIATKPDGGKADLAAAACCGTYHISENDQGAAIVCLIQDTESVQFTLQDQAGIHHIRAGFGHFIETVTTMSGARLHHSYQPEKGLRVAACARWLPQDGESRVLEMEWIFIETAFRDTVRLTFRQGQLQLDRQVNVNSSELSLPALHGIRIQDQTRISDMTHKAFAQRMEKPSVVLIPLGSQEEQGPHAPMGDFMLTDRLAQMCAEAGGGLTAPTLPFGYADFFRTMGGGVQLRAETFCAVLEDMLVSYLEHGHEHLLIFNGHSTNAFLIDQVCRKIRRERDVIIPCVNIWKLIPDHLWRNLYGEHSTLFRGHGGEPLTSVYMHLFPHLVRPDWLAECQPRGRVFGLPVKGVSGADFEGLPVQFPLNCNEVDAGGMLGGSAAQASAEKGKIICDHIVGYTARLMRQLLHYEPRNPLQPVSITDQRKQNYA